MAVEENAPSRSRLSYRGRDLVAGENPQRREVWFVFSGNFDARVSVCYTGNDFGRSRHSDLANVILVPQTPGGSVSVPGALLLLPAFSRSVPFENGPATPILPAYSGRFTVPPSVNVAELE